METLASLFGNTFYLFMILAFLAVVLFVEGAYLMWNAYKGPEARRIAERLQALAAGSGGGGEQASILKRRMLSEVPTFQRLVLGAPREQHLDRFLQQSGLQWTVTRLLLISLVTGCAAALAAGVYWPYWFVVIGIGISAAALPFIYVYRKRRNRLRKIGVQLPDALDLISRALRAGHAFPSALQMVGEELPEPTGGEFRITHDEVNFGVSMQQALQNLSVRVPSTDLRYFVIAVLIQRETGGNLAEVLNNLSTLIRERLKLLMKVQVLSAEGRLSAWILSILPFALAGVINVINPGFMAVLWTDVMGTKMIVAALSMMAIGTLWMRKIIRIHV